MYCITKGLQYLVLNKFWQEQAAEVAIYPRSLLYAIVTAISILFANESFIDTSYIFDCKLTTKLYS